MLTIGGLVLLMIAVLNANRMLVVTDVEPTNSGNQTIVAGLAEDLMAEIKSRKFDENARDSLVLDKSAFTSYTFLGPDGLEGNFALPDTVNYRSLTKFNDIDDYNGYRRITVMDNGSLDTLKVDVYYVSETDDSTKVYDFSYLKKIDIWVVRANSRILKFSSIFAY